jgi:hypothetical protein
MTTIVILGFLTIFFIFWTRKLRNYLFCVSSVNSSKFAKSWEKISQTFDITKLKKKRPNWKALKRGKHRTDDHWKTQALKIGTPEFSEVGTINRLGAVGNDLEVEEVGGSVGEREEEDKDPVDCSPRMNETTSTATKRFLFALIFHLWFGTLVRYLHSSSVFIFNFVMLLKMAIIHEML